MGAVSRAAAVAALISISTPALAEPSWLIQPLQVGNETIRYQKGTPTLDLELADGVVQVTPMAIDHGSLTFIVAVYNDSERPANFGVEHVGAGFREKGVRIFTKDDLVRQAKNRAAWSQFGLALLGGVAAGLSASQRNYYNSSFITPRGTYFSSFSAPSFGGQLRANAIMRDTAFGISAVQYQLDQTVAALGDQVVQLTTVYPGESYAGRVVLSKINPNPMPSQVQLTINWNGEAYPFTFQIAKRGTAAPVFTAITRQSDLIDFRVRRAQQTPAVILAATVVPTVVAQAEPAPALRPAVSDGRSLGGGVRCLTCR